MSYQKNIFLENYKELKDTVSEPVRIIVDTLLQHPLFNKSYIIEAEILNKIRSLSTVYRDEAHNIETLFRRTQPNEVRENISVSKGLAVGDNEPECPGCPSSTYNKVKAGPGLSPNKIKTSQPVPQAQKTEAKTILSDDPTPLDLVRIQLEERNIKYDKRVTNVDKLLALLQDDI